MKNTTKGVIVEVAVYDGRYKTWRILNVTTGSVYASDFATKDVANTAIEHGTERAGYVVRRITLGQIQAIFDGAPSREI
jgi:hypothetical protein